MVIVPTGNLYKPLFHKALYSDLYCFFFYISHLPQGLICDVKLFAGDTSLSSIVNFMKALVSVLNSDLLKIQDWTYHWKMFNPDRTKKAH